MRFLASSDYAEPSLLLRSEAAIHQDLCEYLALRNQGDTLLKRAEETLKRLQDLLSVSSLNESEKALLEETNDLLFRAYDAVKRLTTLREDCADCCEGLAEEWEELKELEERKGAGISFREAK